MVCAAALIGIIAFHLKAIVPQLRETMTQSIDELQTAQRKQSTACSTNDQVASQVEVVMVDTTQSRSFSLKQTQLMQPGPLFSVPN